ncbi:MAG: hypothetical protein ABIH24_07095 [Verrucomicrobiota bacterium]
MSGQPEATEIGVPVKAVTHVKVFAGADGAGKTCLYAVMMQSGARFFVARIDTATGRCEKFIVDRDGGTEASAVIWSKRGNCLYLGTYTGRLYRFVPGVDRLEPLGAIHPGAANFTCSIAEHPDGRLFIGSHPGCDLTVYNPETGEFTRLGRMAPDEAYFYPMAGMDGTIAGLVKVMRPQVVVIDPETGEHRAVGPRADKQKQLGHVELIKGRDGLLYISSHEGNFRIAGMEISPVREIPLAAEPASLPDGSTWRWLDANVFAYRRLALVSPDGREKILQLDWEGDGSDIFMCHAGPDGKIYGSSILPEHFFAYDPATGEMRDHGACSASGGEAYSMANHDGKIYIGSYPAARFGVYDPSRPYRFGTDKAANPREFGRIDEVSYRPFAMVAGPAGKVWTASIPDYGMWGGTLAWFDPATEKFHSHRHIMPDCSPSALIHLREDNLLLVGLAVFGGSGTVPRAEHGGFALWDPDNDGEVWKGEMGLDIFSVIGLCDAGGGLAYALIIEGARAVVEKQVHALVLLDMRRRAIVSRTALQRLPHGYAQATLLACGGYVYGFTQRGIFRAPFGTTDVTPYWRAPEGTSLAPFGAALVGNTLYFGLGKMLCSLPLR